MIPHICTCVNAGRDDCPQSRKMLSPIYLRTRVAQHSTAWVKAAGGASQHEGALQARQRLRALTHVPCGEHVRACMHIHVQGMREGAQTEICMCVCMCVCVCVCAQACVHHRKRTSDDQAQMKACPADRRKV